PGGGTVLGASAAGPVDARRASQPGGDRRLFGEPGGRRGCAIREPVMRSEEEIREAANLILECARRPKMPGGAKLVAYAQVDFAKWVLGEGGERLAETLERLKEEWAKINKE